MIKEFKEDKITKFLEDLSKDSSAAFDIYSRYDVGEEVRIRIDTWCYDGFKDCIEDIVGFTIETFKKMGYKTERSHSVTYNNKNRQTHINLIINLKKRLKNG